MKKVLFLEISYGDGPRLINLDHVVAVLNSNTGTHDCTTFVMSNGKEYLSDLPYVRMVERMQAFSMIKE